MTSMWWMTPALAAAPEIVVLGIAQDAGHPQAGCRKSCCEEAFSDPAAGHRVASLGLIDPDSERVWLVDATPDLPRQLHDLSQGGALAGVLITHAHMGHYTGLIHLGREAMGADAIPVYAMPRMATLLTDQEPWALLGRLGHVQIRPVQDQVELRLADELTATPFLVPHRDELSETVGWIIAGPDRRVAWLPDIDKWSRWDTPLESLLASVDLVFLDGTFYANGELARDMSEIPHPFVTETLQRLSGAPAELRAKVRFVHLNHTNPALDPGGEAARTIRAAGMAIAEEGERHRL
ncbi:MAG TPA: pyrroloquinoline quinone biosynthesis protein PqqB [Deltaproteobacteria bacterium]|nr:pyrroloquinoline quinone biosynthesis protein PqqB [Deltaproteobacteria bacterium]